MRPCPSGKSRGDSCSAFTNWELGLLMPQNLPAEGDPLGWGHVWVRTGGGLSCLAGYWPLSVIAHGQNGLISLPGSCLQSAPLKHGSPGKMPGRMGGRGWAQATPPKWCHPRPMGLSEPQFPQL